MLGKRVTESKKVGNWQLAAEEYIQGDKNLKERGSQIEKRSHETDTNNTNI